MSNLVDVLDFYGFGYEASYNISLALNIANIKVNATDSDSLSTTLIVLNTALQVTFFTAGVERHQIQDLFQNQELRAQIIPLFGSFTDAINDGNDLPIKLMLGATEQGVKVRFNKLDVFLSAHPSRDQLRLGSHKR